MNRIRVGVLAVPGSLFAVATAVAGYIGYLWMFTGFQNYDDEGFILVALRSFDSGHALYDKVAVQYGPFYFEFFGILGALGVSFDNDSGRLVTLAVWLAIALLAGLAVFAFTRNLALGLSAHLITFAMGYSFTGEPMHPGGLVSLLVIGIAAVALFSAGRWSAPWPFAVIGALAAGAILTKINVGGFAAIAIAFASVISIPALARRWPLRLVVAAGFVAVPFALMRGDLGQAWAQRFALDVALSALALVVATSVSRPDPNRRLPELGWLVAGGGVLSVVVIGVALVTGTSPSGLMNGLVLFPLDQRSAFEAPLNLPSSTLLWDGIGVAGAVLWTAYRLRAQRPEVALEGGVRVVVGLVIWVTLLGGLHIPGLFQVNALSDGLVVPLALAWVVAAPRGGPNGFAELDYARALLPSLAILQSLHTYPVAGSQHLWSELALVPVGAVCIGDGFAQLGWSRLRLRAASALVFVTLIVSWLPPAWQHTRAAYATAVPLDLPGATRIRVPPAQAALLTQVTQTLRDNCDSFISIPGVDSFYIFGQLEPPSPPPTRWIWLIGDIPAQQTAVDAAKRVGRLCVIENSLLIAAWSQGHQVPDGPLADYIQSDFVTAYTYGDYTILVRRS